MKTLKKLLKILFIIFFPILILYCIGKNLFCGNIANFLGGVFLFLLGAFFSIYFLRFDLIEPIFLILKNLT